MRRVLALGTLVAVTGALAWACSTDTFGPGDDASTEGGDANPVAMFCAAETQYATYCSVIDASCVQADLSKCADTYATLSPVFAQVLETCVAKETLPCNNAFADGGCLASSLTTFSNDSGVLAMLASDYCHMCAPGDGTCENSFASGVGIVAAIYSDNVIGKIDSVCTATKDASVTFVDAGGECIKNFFACEIAVGGLLSPTSACDGGT